MGDGVRTIGEMILELSEEQPGWSNQEIAEEVQRRRPGAATSAASVSSVKSRARPRDSRASAEASRRSGIESAARYRPTPIGNAQNAVVRNLLGRLGTHGFTEKDWAHVKAEVFGDACAYCGERGKLVMDHAVPINRKSLGEHHLGNLVPACDRCNSRKGDASYAEFLADRPDRKELIEHHMARTGYQPLGDNEIVRKLLESAHEKIAAVARRYARLLNELAGLRSGGTATDG